MADLWPGLSGPTISYISDAPSRKWQTEFPRTLTILGSTGSVGRNCLSVVAQTRDRFRVQGLACGRNVELLASQAARFRPPWVAVQDEASVEHFTALLPEKYRPQIFVGKEGYRELVRRADATTVISAQSGSAGLAATLEAALEGKVICLANKESLVQAGGLLRDLCRRTHASILPVDSEHNALFQCLCGRTQDVESLILTASGGPFWGKSASELHAVTVDEALHHPNWKMGKKISIDSATMMNKGLEIIEAFHLYGVSREHIEVLIHPQSIVHSLVRLTDGSLLAQMATADMKLPLAQCLLWPRVFAQAVPKLDLTQATLSFSHPDFELFPCLSLAMRALEHRGGMCVVLNAANEAAVELFLAGKCSFEGIAKLIAGALDAHASTSPGHEPFCPPLLCREDVQSFETLREFVWQTAARIEELSARAKAVVRNLCQE